MRPFIAILAITVALICLAVAQTFDFVPTQPCGVSNNTPASTAYVHTCGTGGGGGSGTVTSVGLSMPTGFALSGSPITTSGTFNVSWNGTIPSAQLPTPSGSALGGVQSASAPPQQFMIGISNAGLPQFAQPNFVNIAGVAGNAQIPPPTVSALGGVESITCTAGQFINIINASGVPSCSTPAGSGNVSTSGTITSGECAQWNSTTTLISTSTPCGTGNVSTSGTITSGNCAQWASATTILSLGSPCGFGSVTSVGISVPTGLAVSNSPIGTSGTIALSWSGAIPNAQMPAPTTGSLGGVESVTCTGGQFVSGINTSGVPGCSTPAGGGNVSTSGTITSGNCAQWNSATTVISTSAPCGVGTPVFQTISGTSPQSATITTASYVTSTVTGGSPNSVTVTLPSSPSTGTSITFTLGNTQATTIISASTNIIPIESTTADTVIIGTPSTGVPVSEWASIVYNGTNWEVVAGGGGGGGGGTSPTVQTLSFQTVSTDTATISNGFIVVTSGTSANEVVTVTLPAATTSGQLIFFVMGANLGSNAVVKSASANVVPLNSTTAGTNFMASGAVQKYCILAANGTNWVQIAGS